MWLFRCLWNTVRHLVKKKFSNKFWQELFTFWKFSFILMSFLKWSSYAYDNVHFLFPLTWLPAQKVVLSAVYVSSLSHSLVSFIHSLTHSVIISSAFYWNIIYMLLLKPSLLFFKICFVLHYTHVLNFKKVWWFSKVMVLKWIIFWMRGTSCKMPLELFCQTVIVNFLCD